MNQIVGKKPNGMNFVALVLEPGNLHRLKNDQPIMVRVHELFPDGIPKKLEVLISYSETPVADARELATSAEAAFDERSAINKTKRPHCPECRSTIEQLGVWKNESPLALAYCPVCGCVFGTFGDAASLRQGTAHGT